jgi:predicted phosphodiesterase
MNRRDFLALTSSAAAAGYFVDARHAHANAQPEPAATPSPWTAPFDSAPCLQNPTATSMNVTFAVNALCTAWVEFGTGGELDQRADGARHGLLPLNNRVHTFSLRGLTPGTRYRYRVVARPIVFKNAYSITPGEAVRSPVYTFTTPDNGAGGAARFSIINDTHEKADTLGAMTSLLATHPADLHFWNGDIFDDIRSDDQLVAQILRPVNAPYATEVPMCFVAGNHDVRGAHARHLERFAPTSDGLRCYALRQGPVAFVVLDTGEDKPDDHQVYGGLNAFASYRRTQAVWLADVTASAPWRDAKFRVAVMHIPLWGDSCSEDSRAQWHTLLEQGRTDLVINGHVHKHLYTPGGAGAPHRYSQLVGGGPKLDAATFIHGTADTGSLSVRVLNAKGEELASHVFTPS